MKLIYLFLVSSFVLSQNTITLIDYETNEPIPYVNVSGNKDKSYLNSNKVGKFDLEDFPHSDSLTITATGFKQLKVSKSEIKDKIMLHYDEVELDEAVIIPLKNTETLWVNRVKKANSGTSCTFKNGCYMVSRFFDYKKEYKHTPFLNSVNISTRSQIKNAKFKLHFFNVNEEGLPNEEISRKDIIVTVKKGKRSTYVDLKEYKIKFPAEGLFIVYEYLAKPENEKKVSVKFNYGKNKKKEKKVVTFIQPSIMFDSNYFDDKKYFFFAKNWEKNPFKDSSALAIELQLTN